MNVENRFLPSMRQLRAFAAVYHLRKVSAAAEQLSVTQSAVSLSLRQLEDGLGARLFDRTTRTLKPTQAAHEAIVLAERILRDAESLGAGTLELTQLRRGRVSLAITPTLGELLLPGAVVRFRERYPGIHIDVHDCAPDQFVALVVGEQVDFGIGVPEQAGADVDTVTLVRDHLAVVCPVAHPLAARARLSWADLAEQPVITVRPGYGVRPLIDANAARAGVRLRVVHEVTFLSTALWMVRAGMAVAIMPAAYARAAPPDALVVRPLTAPRVSRDICVVTKRGRTLPPSAQALVADIRATQRGVA
ncbi:MAG: LysR family transcriptional regulator [Hydrogenophaga sp.]|uniref:LysR family transcriptional regulator n=1 Tax=Hydrogenophaga sp. TaxID=1904254 RepID=UPI001DF92591|nr:LysR family transcriptional regulator [Hydrogenophaga sp.]MBX3610552.1 LysR family transcriptional regulator [Hydrogenophaga sp.]